jgi:hypothetical protein
MATGRIRRSARRGLAALALGWLAVLVGIVAFAPSASADPTATVYIRDLTPPLVSVDQNGTVTFVDQIQDKTVGVTVGLSLINATVHTDVTLALPSGKHTLQSQPETDPNPEPNSSWKEQFKQSCLTCTITYTYRVTVPDSSLLGTVTGLALAKMPQSQVVTYNGQQTTVRIGVPTPFIVNTLVPLPNLPSVNLPNLPQVDVPLPGVPGVGSLPAPGVTVPRNGTSTITTTTTTTIQQGIAGSLYAYDTGNGAPQLDPLAGGSAAFRSSRVPGGDSSGGFLSGGSGGNPGTSDGAASPAYGLDGVQLQNDSATSAARDGQPALSLPALLAVVCLAGVVAGLVRTAQVRRAHR